MCKLDSKQMGRLVLIPKIRLDTSARHRYDASMTVTDKRLARVERRLRTRVEAALESEGIFLARYGSKVASEPDIASTYFGDCRCLFMAYNGSKIPRNPEDLGLSLGEHEVIESGFEGWKDFEPDQDSPLRAWYDLGQRLYQDYAESKWPRAQISAHAVLRPNASRSRP